MGQKSVEMVQWCNPVVLWLCIKVDVVVPCESNFRGLALVGGKCDGLIFFGMDGRVVGSFST